MHYIFGLCQNEPANILAGEHCDQVTQGLFFIRTNSKYPYARGQDRNEMRSVNIDESEFKMITRNLERICLNLLSSEDDDDVKLLQFLNCKRFDRNVLSVN